MTKPVVPTWNPCPSTKADIGKHARAYPHQNAVAGENEDERIVLLRYMQIEDHEWPKATCTMSFQVLDANLDDKSELGRWITTTLDVTRSNAGYSYSRIKHKAELAAFGDRFLPDGKDLEAYYAVFFPEGVWYSVWDTLDDRHPGPWSSHYLVKVFPPECLPMTGISEVVRTLVTYPYHKRKPAYTTEQAETVRRACGELIEFNRVKAELDLNHPGDGAIRRVIRQQRARVQEDTRLLLLKNLWPHLGGKTQNDISNIALRAFNRSNPPGADGSTYYVED